MPNTLLQIPLIFSRFVHSQMFIRHIIYPKRCFRELRKTFPTIPLWSGVAREKVRSGLFLLSWATLRTCRDTCATSVCLPAAERPLVPPPPTIRSKPSLSCQCSLLCFQLPLISQHEYWINCLQLNVLLFRTLLSVTMSTVLRDSEEQLKGIPL